MTIRYQQQLRFVFDRPVTEPAWYWQGSDEEADPFEGEDPLTAFEFIEALCEAPGKHLAAYSDDQLGQGLNFIFNNSCSNLTHGFKVAPVSFERKEAALRSLFHLFRDVMAVRCTPQQAAGRQEKSTPLNGICYMFWDVTPLSGQWSEVTKAERRACYEAVAWVMQQCLSSPNVAVVESGLHGLGHMAFEYPGVAIPIIDAYLDRNKGRQDTLTNYARAARTGMIQ